MRNIRLTIEYDGTNFTGWQIQRKAQSEKRKTSETKSQRFIQEIVEGTLHKILQEKVKVIASGRTDAGVHALAQVANFKTISKIQLNKLPRALNSLLPPDIAVKKIEEVPLDFHARFNAKKKLYRYTILNSRIPSVFLRDFVYQYTYPLDVGIMRREIKCLLGRHDFKSFCASGSGAKGTVRTIKKITIKTLSPASYSLQPKLIAIDIEVDGFLYNMARNIVGTLLEIGRGRFKKGSLKKILKARNRSSAGPTAPARGLCLLKVNY